MKGLFEEHYVTIPEDKRDELEKPGDKLDEGNHPYKSEKNVTLNSRLAESVIDDILETVSEAQRHSEREVRFTRRKVLSLKVKKNIVKKLETLRSYIFSELLPSSTQQTL